MFTELKMDKWIPQEQDFQVLSFWLHQHSLSSTESHLARLVLTHLNWGLEGLVILIYMNFYSFN